jgi:hypothetical protein
MPLLTTFNCFLTEGFPEAHSTVVVYALFKGGDAFEFDNYKGIMIGPILAKLFVMIFDKKLSEWVEQHGLCAKGQTEFHKYYRTFHIANFDRTKQGKKEATLLLLCGLKKKHSILCYVKCCGMCWLASGWKDVSYNAYK